MDGVFMFNPSARLMAVTVLLENFLSLHQRPGTLSMCVLIAGAFSVYSNPCDLLTTLRTSLPHAFVALG